MNIKFRLSLQFMLIVAGILSFFALLVYYFTFTTYRDKFRNNLLNRARNTAMLLIDVKEIDSTLLKKIHKSTFYWADEELVVTDSNLVIKYRNNVKELSYSELQSHVSSDDKAFFSLTGKDGVFCRHRYKNQVYYSFVLAYDSARKVYLGELRQVLFWSIIFSLWLAVLLSYFFSSKAIRPISRIIDSVNEIDSSSLDKRLDEGNRKDELDQLAMTFNRMLASLEISFRNQQEFVSNASHELKTPVAVMIAETDYFLQGNHSDSEFRQHLTMIINDLKKLGFHLNSLLDLAQMNAGRDIQFNDVRLDEILYDAIHEVKDRYPDRRIIVKGSLPENEDELLIRANPRLLQIALMNLIDNACKFSEKDVECEMGIIHNRLLIKVTDTGIGIPDQEIRNIYKPFNRAANARYKSGFGIGLSLVARILEIHGAEINVISKENAGTTFEVMFQK